MTSRSRPGSIWRLPMSAPAAWAGAGHPPSAVGPVADVPQQVEAERHADDPQAPAAGRGEQELDGDAGEHGDPHPGGRERDGHEPGQQEVRAPVGRAVEGREGGHAGDDRRHLPRLAGDEEVLVREAADHRERRDAERDPGAHAAPRDDEQQRPERHLQRDERHHHERLVVEAAELQEAEEDAQQHDREVLVVGLQQRRRAGPAALGHDDPLVEVERQPAREVEHEHGRPGEQHHERELPQQLAPAVQE
jgi:hypothetical protein